MGQLTLNEINKCFYLWLSMVPDGNPVEADFIEVTLGKVRPMSGDAKPLAQGCTVSEEKQGGGSPGLWLCLKTTDGKDWEDTELASYAPPSWIPV